MDYELTILSQAMNEAGREVLRLAAAGFETFTKSDHSPVTSADLAVNQILHDRLATRFPEDGWLSEETADNEERLSRKRVWIVDPIDGTRSFVRGLPEFCLSVALVENGLPAVAAIFNPATGEFFQPFAGVASVSSAGQILIIHPSPPPNVRLRSSIPGNCGWAGLKAFRPTSTAARSDPSLMRLPWWPPVKRMR